MRTPCLIALAVASVVTAGAEEFFLVNSSSGERLGPIGYTNGATVVIGSSSYRLEKADPGAPLADRMRSIILPSLEFREARLEDVVNFLISSSATADPAKKGVNIVLHAAPPPARGDVAADPFAAAPQGRVQRITLSLHDVSVHDAVNLICQASGMEFAVKERWVEIRPKPPAK